MNLWFCKNNMSKAINSNNVMNQNEINELINEFNKDANIIGRMPDVGELLRAEIIKGGKKHFYFNISGFFDPDRGFLKTLAEIYQRYIEIKDKKRKDLMPFTSLMAQPFKKVMEDLDISPGTFLYQSLGMIYSFVFGAGVGAIVFALYTINPVIGGIATGVAAVGYGYSYYEMYKANKHYKYKDYLFNQGRVFISKIKEIFEKDYNRLLIECNCNIIEFVVDESFNSILDGIFNFDEKKKNSIIVNYWNIHEIVKAKGIKDFPERNEKMYSYIVNNLKFCSDAEEFFKMYEELKRQYHETYKKAEEVTNESNIYKEIAKIKGEIERLKKINPNHPDIPKLNKKIYDMIKIN